MKPYARILVPVDLGDRSKFVLQHAKTIAERFGSALDLLYCFPNPAIPDATGLLNPIAPEVLEESRLDCERQLRGLLTAKEREQFKARTLVTIGDPLDAIVDYAKREEIDLIVMGTHGRTGVAHALIGSVAERVVRMARCPVLTVRYSPRKRQ